MQESRYNYAWHEQSSKQLTEESQKKTAYKNARSPGE